MHGIRQEPNVPSTGPALVLVSALLATTTVVAAPADDAHDELLVVARTVMPRIAYHALEPTANPVRVQATVFPGRVFHDAMSGLVGRLAADDELGEQAPLTATGPALHREPGSAVPIAHGHGLQGAAAGSGGRAIGGSVGGAVLRATSGLGQTILRATGQGTGP